MAIQYGMAETTGAARATINRILGGRSGGTRRRRRTAVRGAKKAAKRATRRATKRASGKAAKFVKGSAAAKRHMAKLRKMVGKRR